MAQKSPGKKRSELFLQELSNFLLAKHVDSSIRLCYQLRIGQLGG
jgi:hypothetical protein